MCYMPTTVLTPGESRDLWLARRRALVESGWIDGGPEGLKGYVHVDDLEKIEGPVPDGLF